MTEDELALAQAELENRMRRVERLYLCAAVVYLAGIVFGVVLAKNWWGL
jgi:hypothetical protein